MNVNEVRRSSHTKFVLSLLFVFVFVVFVVGLLGTVDGLACGYDLANWLHSFSAGQVVLTPRGRATRS